MDTCRKKRSYKRRGELSIMITDYYVILVIGTQDIYTNLFNLITMRYRFLLSLSVTAFFILLAACSDDPDAGEIIDRAIEKHGGERYEQSRISFTFRDIDYMAERRGGDFVYQRTMNTDTAGQVTDRLTNGGLVRTVNGQEVGLTADEDSMYTNSVNSVIYFALLPYKLNDPAVNKKLLGQTTIKGQPYYEIEVTFDQEGGGDDYQDRYIYWIHRQDYTMDYLAYRFQVDGGGTRFREAENVRRVNGIRFADYNNFGSAEMERPLDKYEVYFTQDSLQKVSDIDLENIRVELLDD